MPHFKLARFRRRFAMARPEAKSRMGRAETGFLLDTSSVISEVWEVGLVEIPN